jgi:hypothetical protein
MGDKQMGDIVARLFEMSEAYRNENMILRSLLQERGLSEKRIDKELQKRLKREGSVELAFETLQKAARVVEDWMNEGETISEDLIKKLAEKDHSKMH